jgi:adenylosuccinate synthase
MKKLDVIVDMQFGSTGKGALAGYLSEKNGYYAAISANMPNAGHSAYSPDTGKLFVHKVLPSGIFSKHLKVIGIGPGAVFSIDRLEQEWKAVKEYRDDVYLVIHETAGILLDSHRALEQKSLSRISSTMQGSAEAMISRIRREDGVIAKHFSERILAMGKVKIVDNNNWLDEFRHIPSILVEGSQGYSLGISAGFYPYCTSRDCTPARVMADTGMPLPWLRRVYGSARVHPIRVGNTPDGYSGDWYADQHETTFEQLGVLPELTTVTGRVRRIATFSGLQMWEAMKAVLPDEVFLNFWQYNQEDSEKAKEVIDQIADQLGCGGVKLIGVGPYPSHIHGVRKNDQR